jgi:cytochrome c oxidase subunit 2
MRIDGYVVRTTVMKAMKAMKAAAVAVALCGLVASAPVLATGGMPEPWQLNMTRGVTDTAAAAYKMHMIMLWVCVVIGVIVFGAMGYAMLKFRKSKGAVPDTTFVHSTKIEIIWTTIPVLILIGMAYPATAYLVQAMDTRNAEMTVKVTGYQWKWRYEIVEYKGVQQPVNFLSSLDFDSNKARQGYIDPAEVKVGDDNTYLLNVDRPLVLPTNTKIRFLLTADDVIHAWWVPAFGWKQDAIPGFINEAWTEIQQPGTFRGQCAELCGKDHGFMPIVVEAVSPAEFEQWLAGQGGTLPPGAALAQAPATAPDRG